MRPSRRGDVMLLDQGLVRPDVPEQVADDQLGLVAEGSTGVVPPDGRAALGDLGDRRLAGAVGPQQADDLAGADVDRDALHHGPSAIHLAQVVGREPLRLLPGLWFHLFHPPLPGGRAGAGVTAGVAAGAGAFGSCPFTSTLPVSMA